MTTERPKEYLGLSREEIRGAMRKHVDKGLGFDARCYQIYRIFEASKNVTIHIIAENVGKSGPIELTGQDIEKFMKDEHNPVAEDQRRLLGVGKSGLLTQDVVNIVKYSHDIWSQTVIDLNSRRIKQMRV